MHFNSNYKTGWGTEDRIQFNIYKCLQIKKVMLRVYIYVM